MTEHDEEMMTRKSILQAASITALCTLAGETHLFASKPPPIRKTSISKAIVLWYSQAGNTRRYGEYAAGVLKASGIDVTASDYRDFDAATLADYDLLFLGSPVYYYDVPGNLKKWIQALPSIEGIPAAGFISFGGEGGNQHNTVCTLLNLLAEKGAVPVEMGLFGNMSTYPPTWSMGMEERILKYRHLPNEKTYERVSEFARSALTNVEENRPLSYKKRFAFHEAIKGGFSIFWGARLMTGTHRIDRDKCIQCGTCTATCPTGAIQYKSYAVYSGKCIYCYGCLNNCPASAIDMTYLGKKLTGFIDFSKKHGITLKDPA